MCLEQVIDRFVESGFHLAAGIVVNDVRVKWTCLVGNIHHRDHRADHGVVVQRNLVGIVAALGPDLREAAFGTLHGQKEIDRLVETCLKCGFVIAVRCRLVAHGEQPHFLNSRVVVDGTEVTAAFCRPGGFCATGVCALVLLGVGLVKTAVCDLPCGHVVGVLVNVHAGCRVGKFRIASVAVDFRNRR